MSIALLVQSTDTQQEVTQSLIVPDNARNSVVVYSRTDTGKRGRSGAWTLTDVNTLPADSISRSVVAVRLSDVDTQQITIGKVTNVATKAVNADERNTGIDYDLAPHQDLVRGLVSRLTNGDSSLGDYLNDPRYTTNPVLTPMGTQAIQQTPKISQANTLNITLEPQTATVGSAPILELATIPDTKWAKEYINRKVGGKIDFDVFDYALDNDKNVLIKGHAGGGKTMSVLAYASARRKRYYNVSCHIGVEPSQLFGKWIPTENGHFRWQDGAVTDIVRNGGVLLINEISFMPERVSTVLFSLLDDRREIQLMDKNGEVIKAHPDLLVVADYNPNYRGSRELNQAFNDRFGVQLDYPYDATIESKLIKSKSVLEMANQLRGNFEQELIRTPISTRTLQTFMRNADSLGLEFAIYSYINTFPQGEQAPVKLVIDTHRHNIERDLGLAPASVEPEVDEALTTDQAELAMSEFVVKFGQGNN